jgi:hypothetical protein
MTTPENKVKHKVHVLFEECMDAYQVTVTTAGFGSSGHPDRIVCMRGWFLGVEVKATSKSRLTALQTRRLADLRNAGGFGFVVDADNFEAFARLVKFLFLDTLVSDPNTTGVYARYLSACPADKPYWR